jgi:hypothetical protein
MLITSWRQARQEGIAARDAVRAAYEAKLIEVNQLRQAASIPVLVDTMADASWQQDLQKYYQQQNLWELERENQRRARVDVVEKMTVDDVNVVFGGVVKNGGIYIYHPDLNNLKFSVQLLVCVVLVSIVWIITTLVTKPADTKTLRSFYKLCHPGGPGWRKVVLEARSDGEEIDNKNAISDWKLPMQIVCVFLGCVAIYSSLFSVGNFVYGNLMWGFVLAGIAIAATITLFTSFNKIGVESSS